MGMDESRTRQEGGANKEFYHIVYPRLSSSKELIQCILVYFLTSFICCSATATPNTNRLLRNAMATAFERWLAVIAVIGAIVAAVVLSN